MEDVTRSAVQLTNQSPVSHIGEQSSHTDVHFIEVFWIWIALFKDKEGYQQDFMKTGANHPTCLIGFGLVGDLSDI